MTERVVGCCLALAFLGMAGLALAQPLPPSLQPTIDWSQYPIIAMLLVVIGVLLWRFERHLERKDSAFVSALADHDGRTSISFKDLGTVIKALSDSIGERDRTLIHHLTVAHTVDTVLAQAILGRESGSEITLDQLRRIVEDHLRATGK